MLRALTSISDHALLLNGSRLSALPRASALQSNLSHLRLLHLISHNNQFEARTRKMALKSRSRTVHFYELFVETTSLDPTVTSPFETSAYDLLMCLKPFIKKGMDIGKSKFPPELTDLNWDHSSNELVLLLNKSDPELSDVSYRENGTKNRRKGNKKKNESIELSCHALISYGPSPVAEVKMTMGSGISMDRVCRLFQEVYNDKKSSSGVKSLRTRMYPTKISSPSGSPSTYEVNHTFKYEAKPSAYLVDLLNKGKIEEIELIEHTHAQFDTASHKDEITRRSLTVRVDAVPKSTKKLKDLFAIGKSQHGFNTDEIRVSFKEASGQTHYKTFDISNLDDAFTKSEKIALDSDHLQHQEAISSEIIDKMKELK
jgi:hypothetical protein